MSPSLSRLLPFLMLLTCTVPAPADEIHLVDGEVIHGSVEERAKGRLLLRVGLGRRKVREAEVQQVIAGPDLYAALVQERGPASAWQAWRYHFDGLARVLALESVASRSSEPQRTSPESGAPQREAPGRQEATPQPEDVQELLGRLQVDGAWMAGWSPGWGAPGLTGPRWGKARRAALSRGGGSRASEGLVQRGLAWLAAHQDEDGRLDADGFQRHDPPDDQCDGQGGGHHGERVPCGYDGATTAVALMAWLASGSTPVSGPYREEVAKALSFCVGVLRGGPAGPYSLWNRGFCTQAVADAYSVTRRPDLREVLKAAVRDLLRLQRADGGWSYYLPIGDVPTTGVAASALALANQAGIPVKVERVRRLLAFLDARVDAGSGRSEYHEGAERKGYTPTRANAAAALTVRALFGAQGKAPHRARQLASLGGRKPVWKLEYKEVKTKDGRKVRAQIGNLYPYLWYYTTMALWAQGGSRWTRWFGGLKTALAHGQRKDGAALGSWDPLGTYSSSAGRVFITGLCTLMLQTPYRYPRRP